MSCRMPKHASHTSVCQRKAYKHPCVYTALKGSLIGALITVGIASSTPAFAQEVNVQETGTQGAATPGTTARVKHAVRAVDTTPKAGASGSKASGNGVAGESSAGDATVKAVTNPKSAKDTQLAEQTSTKGAVGSGMNDASAKAGEVLSKNENQEAKKAQQTRTKDAQADKDNRDADAGADANPPAQDAKNSIAKAHSLTKEEAAKLPGCEAVVDSTDTLYSHVIIRPKGGANKGVISKDLNDDKAKDWSALQDQIKAADIVEFKETIYGYGSLSEMFKGTSIRELKDIDRFDVSNVTDMSFMFYNMECILNFKGLSSWNTSKVSNMSSMFRSTLVRRYDQQGADLYPEFLKNWDTSNVKDMSSMFQSCDGLKDLDFLSKWNTKSVTNMSGMFYWCHSLLNIDGVKDWNTSNVTDMSGMFNECLRSTNACPRGGGNCLLNHKLTSSSSNLDALKKWDVSKVSTFRDMFAGCTTLNDASALANWHFADASKVPLIDLCNMLPQPNEDTPTKYLTSVLTHLKDYKGSVNLANWGLTKLNERQVKDTFGETVPLLIFASEEHDTEQEGADPASTSTPAIYKLKSAKKITLSFSNPTEHKIEFGDFPAVCVIDLYDTNIQDYINAMKQEVDELIKKKIQELKKKYPEITGEYTPTKKVLSPEDLFQTYKLAVNMPPRSVWIKPTKVGNPLQRQLAPAHAKLTPAAHMKLAPAQVKPQAAPHGKRVLAQTSDLMWTTSFACLGLMCGFIASACGLLTRKLTRARTK